MSIPTKVAFILVFVFIIIVISHYIFNFHPKATHILFLPIDEVLSNDSKSCVVILRDSTGRLGNHLFMFATALGLSIHHSCQLYIDSVIIDELRQSFEINLPNLISKSELNRSTPVQKIYNHCSFFPQLFHPDTSQFIELIGYWQVHKYFINHRDEITRQLRFNRTILNHANSFLDKNINRRTSISVGIHIRRGDFLKVRPVSSDKYIYNAMAYFVAKYHSVRFIITSDDKPYCRKLLSKREAVLLTPDSFSTTDDLATLTLCDHIIITVGTFGWWGAFLLHNRTGEVITDSKPDHTPLDVNCERAVYFPFWFSFLNNTV
jgi:galactoside 2-L-fucosyltransferase 1/2